MRTVSFNCPHCRLHHQGEHVVGHEASCDGQAIYFTDKWEPTLDPALRGTNVFNWPAALFWPVVALFVLWALLGH